MSDAAKGTIYDLGYKRYAGTRRSQGTRWMVIMRHQIATGWKTWWRYKLALFGAVVTAFVAGGFLYFRTSVPVRAIGAAGGGEVLTILDLALPRSIEWFCRMGFILSLTLSATIVAADNQSGAFTFYYVRPVRPLDYVLGKLAGLGFLVATIVLVGPLMLAGARLGFSDNTDQLVANLVIVPKVLAICGLATLAYTAMPLAMSALVPNRRYALALWAAYYLIVGNIGLAIGATTPGMSWLSSLDLQTAVQSVTYDLFDMRTFWGTRVSNLEADTAVISLLVQGAIATAIIWFQVSRDQRHGVGGSS